MIDKLVIPMLLIIVLMYVMDRKKLKNSSPANCWFAYSIYAVSFVIWLCETSNSSSLLHPSVLLAHVIDALVPLP
ncbi:hypothetical protein OIN60_05205 [Paenibacillus sp. P96]|uniref:Uncharacterized protein n=1 Tax=Paenibacillus zeirhizosphaerae TaxID=2987519 RepID=A0ABT9FN64_9BACL|nr:hypothetical protein [Paenibacillus sp. P96]MDP4096167.1 hypothetical protein [Paenibacillus sp. P96]